MAEFYPLFVVGAVIGTFTLVFVIAYALMKNKKESIGFDRNMKDSEIIVRLLKYARPHWASFLLALVIMLLSISYDIIAPIIVGDIEKLVVEDFELSALFLKVAAYAGILAVSMLCTYFQAIILQKTGQKILSSLRQDLFTHIESLSHNQLNNIPVGKLVTRVTNDTNAISMMFTHILVTMVKNVFVIFGVLTAMLLLNYQLTLMVLCFVPFVVLFTWIFRKFSRKAYRAVKDGTTDINTYLSENLSGIKITQIFNREDKKMEDFLEKSTNLRKAKQKQIFVFGVFRPMVYMLYISSVLCLLYLGGRGYIKDTVFLGQAVSAN
ncbi:MAG: ABC transporter ATP-binding protein, partial [Clostridia bacterium]|nr:ABC transporter ATP-binding protein [Clostridia bacterium]